MAQEAKLSLEWIEGLPPKKRRGLAWITSRAENNDFDGKSSFEALPTTPEQRQFRNRFDAWLDWHDRKIKWFHGWPNENDFKNVFQFRYHAYRLMGFLCHPDIADRRFQLCVLVLMTTKFTKHTEKRLKNLLQDLADKLDLEQLFENIQ